jgi:hypothetical protein
MLLGETKNNQQQSQKSNQQKGGAKQAEEAKKKESEKKVEEIEDDSSPVQGDGVRIQLKRKGSSSSNQGLRRKLSDADYKMPRKVSKKFAEQDELIYGNEPYPSVEYHV